MKWLQGAYAQRFNLRHNVGPLAIRRYKALLVDGFRRGLRMKKIIFFILGMLVVASGAELREWSSGDGGSTMSASLVKVLGDKVVLKSAKGRRITVPINRLGKTDQAYLAAYSREQALKKREAEQVVDLPYAQGEVVGPIQAGSHSSYFLYLPKSLRHSRKVPLLFYTHALGGNAALLEGLVDGAEIAGWIMAISIESRNDNTSSNLEASKKAVGHIIDTLPVDEDRLYFTGNSGGGAQAYENADAMDACGVMPNIGYIPSRVDPPDGHCFILNGGYDYNRYAGAHARKEIGDRAVHRFFPQGHAMAPEWLMEEGILWLEGQYLAERGKRVPEEQLDYEQDMLEWLDGLKTSEPHRAYYWGLFLETELTLSTENRAAVVGLVDELKKNEINRLYVEGLTAIDQLSLDTLSRFNRSEGHGHCNKSVVSACNDLLMKYNGVPFVEEILEALKKPTQ